MRNLLTEPFKRRLRKEYLLRLLAVSGWALTLAMVVGVLALLPAYLLSKSRLQTLSDQHALLQASIASLSDSASSTPLSVLEAKLQVLSQEKQGVRFTETLLSVLSTRGQGVALVSFDYGHEGALSMLKLRGTAESRDALLDFQHALEAQGRFDVVDLPVSNLASESDITFDITLSGSF